ncbi:9528_t:CDS:2 [Cetraspora pellucida]|uniref:9528_t:CDS:1 n=1 Tax=Cetraspora pellucida TaxID=1433469 RepID=A0A9N8VN36_9GLOM|nr:9528_t:CDS:2 [Cetraspora pellucida]
MLCHADTIVRVKYVKQYKKEDINLLVVWALGAYSVKCKDYDIKMTLFVTINPKDWDYKTQAVFEKDHFFLVMILNKVIESNKCLLKVSLVRVPQKMPNEIKDYAIFKTLVTDYFGQEQNFIMNVVFSYNSHLIYLKDIIRALKSLIFVVGQLEIIDNEFYVLQKMLVTWIYILLNIVESSKEKSVNETSNSSNCFLNESVLSSRDYPSAAKHLRTGNLSGSSDEGLGNVEYIDHGSCTEASIKKVGEFTESSKNKKTISLNDEEAEI